jgi:cytosine/adenosine deaminase-related metal-dependent hydrolase
MTITIQIPGQGHTAQGQPAWQTTRLHIPDGKVFPGLVNSHDHLDFNCFPRLGNRIYEDYTEWGKDIHEHNSDSIRPVLQVPGPLRTRWGLYKNLLSGFTTVVNHGPRVELGNQPLITVIQDCKSLHSLSGERYWKFKLNRPLRTTRLIAIHIGEGTSPRAKKEIDTLCRWNLLRKDLVGIHGITMEESQAGHFKALVWCPDSNYFLYGHTADIRRLKTRIPILFGSDSTLSARWNIREQLRIARNMTYLNDTELLEALTTTPTAIWGHPAPADGDFIVLSARSLPEFFAADPEDILLVAHDGKLRLFDAALADQLPDIKLAGQSRDNYPIGQSQDKYPIGQSPDISSTDRCFSRIAIGNTIKYVQGDLPGLMKEIRHYHPGVEFPVRPV